MRKIDKKRILLFNFIALIGYLFIALPKLDYKEQIQAVDMELINYKKDTHAGKSVAKVQGGVGSAKIKFNGPSGIYDIHVEYIDEDDGESQFRLKINNTVKADWTANFNPTKDRAFIQTLERLVLFTGDSVEIEGTRNKGESARLASIRTDFIESVSFTSYAKFALIHAFQFIAKEGLTQSLLYCISLIILNLLGFLVYTHRTRTIAALQRLGQREQAAANQKSVDDTILLKADALDSDHLLRSVPSSLSITIDNKALLEEMLSYMEANYTDRNFTLQKMSERFNISSNYLSMYFKKHTGQNIVLRLTHLRLERAKHYLAHTDLPLQAVANQSGYYNISSFIRKFKAKVGVTPGVYRKLAASKDEAIK